MKKKSIQNRKSTAEFQSKQPSFAGGLPKTKQITISFLSMIIGTGMFIIPAFAADTATAPDASKTMINLINLMLSMFKYVGAAIFVWAIIQFILATKRSDADSKADAVQTAVCGIALMGIRTVIVGLGIGAAIDKTGEQFRDDALTKTTGGTT